MSKNSLVSVIIPTYKRSAYLRVAIDSVLSQTYKNIEIIVVDDNDGENEFRKATRQGLNDLIESNKVRYITHETNMGLSAARNTGIKNSTGEFIAFIDDDDIWEERKLQLQLERFESLPADYGVVYSAYTTIDENGKEGITYRPKYRGDLSNILGVNHVGPPSMVVVKTQFLRKVEGFSMNFKYRSDLELYYRLSKFCKFDYIPETVMFYRVHSANMSSNVALKLTDLNCFIHTYAHELKSPRWRWSQILERQAELIAGIGDKWSSFRVFVKAYLAKPTRLQIVAKCFFVLTNVKRY